MTPTLEQQARALAAGSELLRDVAAVRRDGGIAFALGDTPVRPLRPFEIQQLEAGGNTAFDWSRVRVGDWFNPRRVRNCEFLGDVALGDFRRPVRLADGVEVASGLSNSTLADCVIGHNAAVRDVRLLAGYVVGPGAVVMDCGRVVGTPGTAFGNGERVPLALEGGGRDVEVFAELGVELAAAVASPGPARPQLDGYRKAVADYRAAATGDRGIIAAGAVVAHTPRVEDVYVGPSARIDGAASVRNSTLLSDDDDPTRIETGAVVEGSLLQWGARVSVLAVVERSVLTGAAVAERHAKVRASLLGPNTEVAAGEVVSCLLGPFVGSHHQSLLISAFWPGGRGNVGYGANAGSNHTSRAPDQEFRPGEGLFLGLGVNIKFPCDFSRSPYTVVACATVLPPQRVEFPFALVAPGDAGEWGGLNRIVPAWVLSDNAYLLKRTEVKFAARNRDRRSRFDLRVLRPDTVQLMLDAARRLETVPHVREWYTERHVPGLGKNVLLEEDRLRAIEAYRQFARYYALGGLKRQVEFASARSAGCPSRLLAEASADVEWESQRRLLADLGVEGVAAGLREFARLAERVAREVERTKAKDDARGPRVIDDYADVHPPAEQDRIVRRARNDAVRIGAEVAELLRRLAGTGPRAAHPEGVTAV